MLYEILLTSQVEADLKKIPKYIGSRILDKLEYFIKSGKPLQYAKKMTDFKYGQYRFRIGDYRVVFDINTHGEITILSILAIGHRKDIYRG